MKRFQSYTYMPDSNEPAAKYRLEVLNYKCKVSWCMLSKTTRRLWRKKMREL